MKKILILLLAIVPIVVLAQGKKKPKEPYTFTDITIAPQTSVKNQGSSGTCWSFSGTGYIESELLRQNKGEYDLSDMWIVRHTYFDKALKYARMHGKTNLSAGGATHDVFNVIDEHGIVPEEIYTGLDYGTEHHIHSELDNVIKSYMDAIIRNPNRTLSTSWKKGLNAILDAYLGEVPTDFTYKGKTYTPKSFAKELGIKGDDYISLTSFTHHPYEEYFAIEVPDNWAWEPSKNVSLDEFTKVIDATLKAGYSIFWASDVSDKGFRYNQGFAVLPESKLENLTDSEKAKWSNLTEAEVAENVFEFKEPVTEIEITPELRQKWFDNYSTTDDHGMVIVGVAEDQDGRTFYKVKNSWGDKNVYDGYFYVSPVFVAGKTLNIVISKEFYEKFSKK